MTCKAGADCFYLDESVSQRLVRLVMAWSDVLVAGDRFTDIDVETSKALIEVTNGDGQGKLGQLRKLKSAYVNPDGKEVIPFAPSLTAGRAVRPRSWAFALFGAWMSYSASGARLWKHEALHSRARLRTSSFGT